MNKKSRFLAIIRQYMHTGVYHSVLRLNILFTQKEQIHFYSK